MKELQLVEYADRAAGDIYLLNGDVMRPPRRTLSTGWGRPLAPLTFVDVPVVLVLVVFQVLGFVYCREGA